MKKIIAITLLLLTVGTISFAASYNTPASVYGDLTGQTEDEAYAERNETDKSFGQLADEAGVIEEFRDAMLQNKIARIEELVEEGSLTREEADDLIATIEENVANCDPSTWNGRGNGLGLNFGRGNGMGQGQGRGYRGQGRGNAGGFGGGCWR